jgi:hypothetical protein
MEQMLREEYRGMSVLFGAPDTQASFDRMRENVRRRRA